MSEEEKGSSAQDPALGSDIASARSAADSAAVEIFGELPSEEERESLRDLLRQDEPVLPPQGRGSRLLRAAVIVSIAYGLIIVAMFLMMRAQGAFS